MAFEESLALIQRARDGDRQAWEAVLTSYYPRWCKKFHGKLRAGLRRLYDTEDLVQSALTEALRDIGTLRSEAAFFSWVSAIVRRKIAEKHRLDLRIPQLPIEAARDKGKSDSKVELPLITTEEYLRFLDTLIDGFSLYPEPMAVVYLKYFEQLDLATLAKALERSERTVQRLLRTGLAVLGAKLDRS